MFSTYYPHHALSYLLLSTLFDPVRQGYIKSTSNSIQPFHDAIYCRNLYRDWSSSRSRSCKSKSCSPWGIIKSLQTYQFLDFASIPTWSPEGFIKSITPIAPAQKLELKPDEKIQVEMRGATFRPVIVKNEPGEFAWIGR